MPAATEWWTTPGEAERRLNALTAFWASLRSAAVARSGQLKVPAAVHSAFETEYAAFRKWRESIGGVELVTSWADELTDWTARANRQRAALGAAGGMVPAELTEWTAQAPQLIVGGLTGLVLLAAGAFWFASRKRGQA